MEQTNRVCTAKNKVGAFFGGTGRCVPSIWVIDLSSLQMLWFLVFTKVTQRPAQTDNSW